MEEGVARHWQPFQVDGVSGVYQGALGYPDNEDVAAPGPRRVATACQPRGDHEPQSRPTERDVVLVGEQEERDAAALVLGQPVPAVDAEPQVEVRSEFR